jgi:hypothetical protein
MQLTTRTSTERNQEQSPLLHLPPELRINIFELALSSDTAVIRSHPLGTFGNSLNFRRVLPGFITACRQIHHESKPLLSDHSILEVLFSRDLIRITKRKDYNARKLKMYSDAAQEIMWRTAELGRRFGKIFVEADRDRDLLHDSFPALETIEFPGDWKDKSCEDAVQYWFKRPELQVTYHWDLEPELDLED